MRAHKKWRHKLNVRVYVHVCVCVHICSCVKVADVCVCAPVRPSVCLSVQLCTLLCVPAVIMVMSRPRSQLALPRSVPVSLCLSLSLWPSAYHSACQYKVL